MVRLARLLPVLLAAAAALVVAAPQAIGFSGGITTQTAGVADFDTLGCTACHGPGAPHADFAATGAGAISWSMKDAEGNGPAGNVYEHDAEYTITVTLAEQVQPAKANHAGFNLRVNAGKLAAVEGQSQTNPDGSQATHVGAGRTTWDILWTAPADGPAIFDLFVNDVDGSGAPDAGDAVHRVGWFLTDESHALPGAAEEHEVHYGISLQQYWIGLIGLAGMVLVMLAGFVYLKFVNPHNTDQKDR